MTRKILVYSNCQAETLSEALAIIRHSDSVQYLHIPESPVGPEYLRSHLEDGVDVLVTADTSHRSEAFAKQHPQVRVLLIPQVVFPAFHPDIVYATAAGGKFVRCLDADYHSAICLWGWKNRLSPERTAGLFNERTFHELGYLHAWDESVSELRKSIKAAALDFGTFWRSIQRTGVFMHSLNHPKVHVLAEIAKQIAVKLGTDERIFEEPIHDLLTDKLDALRWPVYPEVGALYGAPSMYRWKIRKRFYNSLDEYVTQAFGSYDTLGLGHDDLVMHTDGYQQFDAVLKGLIGEQR